MFTEIPFGIADFALALAFVAAGNSILALDISDGAVVASGEIAAMPLAADGSMLVAWSDVDGQKSSAEIIAATHRDDEIRVSWRTTLEFPAWVNVGSTEADDFAMAAEIDESTVTVTWRARSRYGGGAPPSAEREHASRNDAHGTFGLDRATGAISASAQVDDEDDTKAATPIEAMRDRLRVPYRMGTSWSTDPWQHAGVRYALVRSKSGTGVAIVGDEPMGAKETALATEQTGDVAVTHDGAFVLVGEQRSAAAQWTIYRAADGQRIGSVPADPGTEWITVADRRVFSFTSVAEGPWRQLAFNCRSLDSGETLWSRSIDRQPLRAAPPLPP
jgi:hypothetical protein